MHNFIFFVFRNRKFGTCKIFETHNVCELEDITGAIVDASVKTQNNLPTSASPLLRVNQP